MYVFMNGITPGPNNIMSMNGGTRIGFRRTFPFNCGVLVGVFIIMALCLLFSSVLYQLIPRIRFPMKIAGALYMLFLAWKTVQHKVNPIEKEATGSFFSGVFLQFLNVKLIVHGITVMSSFILPVYCDMLILAGFALLLAFSAFACTLCWSGFGSLFNHVFSKHGHLISIIMALLLMYCVISLFL
jgi:threonine/homoserine/homoserine lactone efflux protein